MKPEETHTEIGDLLRSRKPETGVPPGLEGRILRAVAQEKHRPSPVRWWRWPLVPPAVALLMVVFAPREEEDGKKQATARPEPPPARMEPDDGWTTAAMDTMNPLERESQALKRDAERAGRFLMDCLPSVNSVTER